MTASRETPYSLSENASERLNIARLWFSIMVVYIHSFVEETVNFASESVAMESAGWVHFIQNLFSNCICRVAVPGFFLFSAILLYRKPFAWGANAVKKAKRLMIPYLLLNTFWILFYLVAQAIPFTREYFSSAKNIIVNWTFMDYLNAYLGFRTGMPRLYPLWFLRDLFVLNLLAPIFSYAAERFPRALLAFFTLLWLFLESTGIFFLDMQALCFWGIGCCIVKLRVPLDRADRLPMLPLGIAVLLLTAADSLTLSCSWNLYLHRFYILLALLFWFRLAGMVKNAKHKRFLLKLSAFNFDIFLFHQFTLTIVKKIAARFLPATSVFQCLEYLLIPVCIVVYCIALSAFLKRFLPRTYRLLTGSSAH